MTAGFEIAFGMSVCLLILCVGGVLASVIRMAPVESLWTRWVFPGLVWLCTVTFVAWIAAMILTGGTR